MSLSNQEYYEMMLCVGATDGDLSAAQMLYHERFREGQRPTEDYLDCLRDELNEELTVMPVTSYVDLVMDNNLIFQHDCAPAHFARDVRSHLNARFPQWIGRGGRVAWPARSPDLTPLDFYGDT